MSKNPKDDENRRKSSYLLNDLSNFSEIFRNDNIKRHKKQGFTLSLEDNFWKNHRKGQTIPTVTSSGELAS